MSETSEPVHTHPIMTPYIPPGCSTLAAMTSKQQIRLGIQGFPGVGKTWSALTFPKPVVVNLNKGLGVHIGREDVISVERSLFGKQHEVKDRLLDWLNEHGPRFSSEQTLILDSLTDLETYYHLWYECNKMQFLTKTGKLDDFAEWSVKEKYFDELFNLFQGLSCDIVVITHETEQPDKQYPGQAITYSGKIRPLFTGKIKDKLTHTFTDWFRQGCCDKPSIDKITPDMLSSWKVSIDEMKAMLNTFPDKTLYYWQTQGDDKFDAKASSLVSPPKFMPANFPHSLNT